MLAAEPKHSFSRMFVQISSIGMAFPFDTHAHCSCGAWWLVGTSAAFIYILPADHRYVPIAITSGCFFCHHFWTNFPHCSVTVGADCVFSSLSFFLFPFFFFESRYCISAHRKIHNKMAKTVHAMFIVWLLLATEYKESSMYSMKRHCSLFTVRSHTYWTWKLKMRAGVDKMWHSSREQTSMLSACSDKLKWSFVSGLQAPAVHRKHGGT